MKYFVFDNDGETYIVNANEVRVNNIMIAAFRLDAIIGFNEMTEEEDN